MLDDASPPQDARDDEDYHRHKQRILCPFAVHGDIVQEKLLTRLLAIDPGPVESAYCLLEDGMPKQFAKLPNFDMRQVILQHGGSTPLCVEMIASYGMAVGREVFETCVWIGRFVECYGWSGGGRNKHLVYRKDVKMHLCGTTSAKDSNIRQALIDRYGPGKEKAIGKKASPGPLYGMAGDCWAALGVAVTAHDTVLHA